jgi:dTDP-4-dehydrorhamnose reductase
MLRLARERSSISIVDDQLGSPTTSIELARATRKVVDGVLAGQFGATQDWAGLYHTTCSGSVTWFGFAQAIFARAAKLLDGKIPELIPIASEAYPTPARRPRYSVLSNAKLAARFGVSLAPWQDALDTVVQTLSSTPSVVK